MMIVDPNRHIAKLPALSDDDCEDAEFRGRDRAWSALVALFDHYRRTDRLSYEQLGKRIHRSRSQVQRWLSSAFNMNLRSLGLLAEGLDADLVIDVVPRRLAHLKPNRWHPAEYAKLEQHWATQTGAVYQITGQSNSASTITGEVTKQLVSVEQ